jgi:hypothetical protein
MIDFICIGAQKAGTSWLFEVLCENPSVWLAPYKEVHFFDRDGKRTEISDWERKRLSRLIRRERARGDQCNDAYVDYLQKLRLVQARTLDWYRQVYSWQTPEGVVRGEITPSYLDLPEERVAYARQILGSVKVILIVRWPYDREISQIRMRANRAIGQKGRRITTDLEWTRFYDGMKLHGARGSYEAGISNWERHFGKENVLIMPFGDIRDEPERFIERTETFLGIPHFENYQQLRQQIHPTKKREIPQHIKDLVQESAAAEVEYLKSRFDDDFMRRIR